MEITLGKHLPVSHLTKEITDSKKLEFSSFKALFKYTASRLTPWKVTVNQKKESGVKAQRRVNRQRSDLEVA